MKLIVKENKELLEYLCKYLDMSRKKIKSYLTHGDIYIHHNRITQYNYPLEKGMEIVIDTNQKNRKSLLFDIVYEDDEIIVVNKPSGLLTIATLKEKEKTLYHYVSEYLKSKDKKARVFIVHRLDKDTSGVVLLAKNEKMKNKLQKNWNRYVSIREYTAVVFGVLKKKSDRLVNSLLETKTNLIYITKKEEGKEAITNYQVVKENKNYSLLKIHLETGRKNQIRVQLAAIYHPIVGDLKYGDKTRSKDFSRLYLHANKLKLFYPKIKKEITFEVKIPSEFKKLV